MNTHERDTLRHLAAEQNRTLPGLREERDHITERRVILGEVLFELARLDDALADWMDTIRSAIADRPDVVERLEQLLPSAETTEMTGGHACHLEELDRFCSLIAP